MSFASDVRPLDVLLRRLHAAAPLTDDDIRAVEALPMTVRSLGAGQYIMREADRPSQACLVLEGWLYGFKDIEGGRRQIISLHLPGDVPDLQNLRMHVADFSLSTLTKATVAFIPHEKLRASTLRHAALTAALWHLTLIDAARFRQWITGLGRRPAPERLAHLLCELYVRQRGVGLADDDGCPLPMTQADLGDVLGMTSVHINRVLKDLRGRELVTLRGRRLAIHDWARLTSFANFDPAYLHLDDGEPS